MPAAIGEVGSIPAVWAERMISKAVVRGWRIMPWAFSHYDEWVFDEDTQPQVLQFIQATNVAYGAAIGEPDPDLDTPSWSPRTLIPNEGLTWAPRTPTGETSLWVGSALWVGTALWP